MSLEILTKWRDTMVEVGKVSAPAYDILGTESKLMDALGSVEEAYTRAVAKLVDADECMLIDFWLSHEFGARPMYASVGENDMQAIGSIEALWEFISEVNANAEGNHPPAD